MPDELEHVDQVSVTISAEDETESNAVLLQLQQSFKQSNLKQFQDELCRNTPIDYTVINPYKIPWYKKKEHLLFLEAMIKSGFNVNSIDPISNKAAVHLAVEFGNIDLLRYLLQQTHANVNLKTTLGDTPLHCIIQAKGEDYLDCLEVLLDHPDILPNIINRHGYTPFHLASIQDKKKYKELFINKYSTDFKKDKIKVKGAPRKNRNAVLTEPEELFNILKSGDYNRFCEKLHTLSATKRSYLDNLDSQNWTLLQNACAKGAEQVAETLLSLGADVNLTTDLSYAPINLACKGGHVSIIELLMKHPNLRLDVNEQEKTLLHILAQSPCDTPEFSIYMETALMKYPDDVNKKDNLGRTPLHYAIILENENRTLELLNHGAHIDIKDNRRQKPIHIISYSTMKKFLDSKITTNNCGPNDKDYEIKFDYSQLLRQRKDHGYEFPTNVLYNLKRTEHLNKLLTHPILSFIISIKWRLLQIIVLSNAIIYLLFATLFTAYLLLGIDANNSSTTQIQVTFILSWLFLGTLIFFEVFHVVGYPEIYRNSLDSQIRITMIVVCLITLVFNCSVYPFNPFKNITECSSSYDCARYHLCPHLSAISMLLTWFEFFFIFGKIPPLTFYVSLFRSAFFLLVKFLLIHIPIILGFSLSFTVMFTGMEGNIAFSNGLQSLFKTLIMVTGEFDASDITFDALPITSQIIFIAFICTISIVLFNLLIGLATSAAQDIENKPFEYQCRAQVWLIARFERIFFAKKNKLQKLINSIFWSHICNFLLRVNYGKTVDLKTYNYGNTPDMSDFIITFLPNKKNKLLKSFIFFTHKKGGLVVKKSNVELLFQIEKEISDRAKKIVIDRKITKRRDEMNHIKNQINGLTSKMIELHHMNQRIFDLLAKKTESFA